jgi:hypothetical protein
LTGYYAEDELGVDVSQSAFLYAIGYNTPAIAIYDPSKMEKGDFDCEYKMKDPSALLAIIILK